MESEEKKVMCKWLKLGMRTLDFTKTGHEWKKSQDESLNTGKKTGDETVGWSKTAFRGR